MTKGSDLLVAALESEGVDRIFGVPGEENLDVVESLRRSRIELVLTRHEQSAGFMAATHGRLTGQPGVCMTTLGPGALNLTTGAAYALLGAMPMVMITGQKPILSSRQARFQIVDVVAAMTPLTKLSRQIVSAASIPTNFSRSRLTSGSPPVSLNFSTPCSCTKIRVTRAISSNVSSAEDGRNWKSRPNTSLGMQYVHRKLHRSVTEIRKSCSGLPSRSVVTLIISRRCACPIITPTPPLT